MSFDLEGFLRARGWSVAGSSFDTCWLDCPEQGYLKRWGDKCICLCGDHALTLEKGSYGGDYDGAPLPAESIAADWPWRPWADFSRAILAGSGGRS